MDCRPIPYRRTPHAARFFLDYIENFARVAGFFAHAPRIGEALRLAKTMEYPGERRRAVCAALRDQNAGFGAGAAAMKNIERLEAGAAVAVTGQQAGLFTGPAYAIYKTLTAIQLAEEMTAAGVPTVPVFWIATEDHDLAEVNHSFWFARNETIRYELAGEGSAAGKPVGNVALGPQIEEFVREGSARLAGSGADEIAQLLRESYTAGDTFGSAFGKCFARLFAAEGLILLDPMDARLHRAAAPLLQRAIAERDALQEELTARGKALDAAGYEPQVKVAAQSTLVFRTHEGVRHAVTVQEGGFRAGEQSFSREELVRQAQEMPEKFSGNVLLRPVMQDYLLPSAAYVAGPAEIAYCAQAEVLYRRLLGRMPVVFPRASFTILEPAIGRYMQRYELTVEDVWEGREKLRDKIEAKALSVDLAQQFDAAEAGLKRSLEEIEKPLAELDPTLRGALETARDKMLYQLENLRRKAGRAREARDGLVAAHLEALIAGLYPNRVAQQRALCFLPVLAVRGLGLLRELLPYVKESREQGHEGIVNL